jgi:hypothetical protein
VSELQYVWRAAQEEARWAYAAWSETLGADGYCVYRAAQDRADAAQDALAAAYNIQVPARTASHR